MSNWLLDELWLERSNSWFNTAHQLFSTQRTNSMSSFADYLHPVVDRLSSTMSGDNRFDYFRFYTNRATNNSRSKSFSRRYQLLDCIGKGGYGYVYNARRKLDNLLVVLKVLPRDRILNWGMLHGKQVPYEIEVLWRLRGLQGVVQLLDHFEEVDRYIFTMEKIPHSTTLFNFIMETLPLPNTELLRHLFRELVNLNLTLELYGVWHRDCKPENIIYCKSDRSLRFIDFGSAAPVQQGDFHEFQGTLEIMVPEWILQRRYSGERACVWALGVCLYFLLFQEYPFRSKSDIVNGRSRLPYQYSVDKEAFHTMRQCLHGNEYKRPRLADLQQLSWLK